MTAAIPAQQTNIMRYYDEEGASASCGRETAGSPRLTGSRGTT